MKLTFATHLKRLAKFEKEFNESLSFTHRFVLLCAIEDELQKSLEEITKRTNELRATVIEELSQAAFGI